MRVKLRNVPEREILRKGDEQENFGGGPRFFSMLAEGRLQKIFREKCTKENIDVAEGQNTTQEKIEMLKNTS